MKICGAAIMAALLVAPARGQEPTPAPPSAPAAASAPAPAPAASAPTAAASPGDIVPLGRYIAKDNLVVYFEFAGLDAHADSWKKTAASKMLLDTPLGSMLDEVSAQLLDRVLSFVPDRRFTGAEVMTLFKHAARSGFAMALHINPKESGPWNLIHGTLVVRGAAAKPVRPITSRVMGWMMGSVNKPKIEFREGRSLVFVPAGPAANAPGWAWWAEKDDLVISSSFPKAVETTLAARDGKAASAVDHPIVQELSKPEGTFQPIFTMFIDTAGCPRCRSR